MCGIAGIYKINAPTTPEDVAAVQRMMDAQVHRGPGGEGMVAVKVEPGPIKNKDLTLSDVLKNSWPSTNSIMALCDAGRA
jgi:asparagine synthetase B (glutamine-hydrolysing)